LISWLRNNLWNILTVAVAIIIGWAYLQSAVRVNAQAISQLERRIDAYPSEEYFELKFQTIDNSIRDVRKDLNTLENKVDRLPQRL